MKTLKGIYYNINESDYFLEVGRLRFYFSSPVYLRKFEERYKDYVNNFNLRWGLKFYPGWNYEELGLIKLYREIETRGMRVEIDGIGIENYGGVHIQ